MERAFYIWNHPPLLVCDDRQIGLVVLARGFQQVILHPPRHYLIMFTTPTSVIHVHSSNEHDAMCLEIPTYHNTPYQLITLSILSLTTFCLLDVGWYDTTCLQTLEHLLRYAVQ